MTASNPISVSHVGQTVFLAIIGVLRLRSRPTRKSSGSELLCGRSAQDDTFSFF